jgi:hypothetical protein
MRALLVVGVTWWIAAALGRSIINLLVRRDVSGTFSLKPSETLVFTSALGLGIVAYGVFALGLVGLLTAQILAVWLTALALLGIPGMRSMSRDLHGCISRFRKARRTQRILISPSFAIGTASLCVLTVFGVVAVAACFQPPGAHAWDALAYHLADPKIYLQHHRIVPLPTQHHSNFPFTMEMLFTIGLAYGGFAAANLFHLLTAGLLLFAMVAFCDRFLSRRAGVIACLMLATTPLALWEATVAYIDLGLALYVFLAAYAVILAAQCRGTFTDRAMSSAGLFRSRIMFIGAVLLGFALGIKYLAVLPLGMLLVLALFRRIPVREIAMFAVVACAVGCPWYVKNIVWMRNPVYPFAYSVFTGSRYWTAERALPYMEEQRSFGKAPDLNMPIEALRNLVMTPWMLLTSPEIYTNRADFTFTSLIGGLYAGFMFSLTYVLGKPRGLHDVLLIFLFMLVSWFFVSQHIRYLIPALPFGAVLAGYGADTMLHAAERRVASVSGSRRSQFVNTSIKFVNKIAGFVAGAAVAAHIALVGWGITMLPVAGLAAEQAHESGLEPTALSVPEVAAAVARPDERDRQMRRLNSYGAAEWINRNAPAGIGVVLYEDVHGFYLNRPYLWGNGEHSSYIPYEHFTSGRDLTAWLRSARIGYALFNLNSAPSNSQNLLLPDDIDSVSAIMRGWYDGKGKGWRRLVGECIQSGEWVVRFTHHGVAVLEIGAPRP